MTEVAAAPTVVSQVVAVWSARRASPPLQQKETADSITSSTHHNPATACPLQLHKGCSPAELITLYVNVACCLCWLRATCSKNNAAIVSHMEAEGIDFLQFAFRWVNCLLIREVPFNAALRLWDTYLAEGPRFNEFLVRHTLCVHMTSLT